MEVDSALAKYFPSLTDQQLADEIVRYSKVVEVRTGTQLLKEDSYVKTIPLLMEGLIKVVKHEGMKEMLLYYIYPKESCIISIQCGINNTKSNVKAFAEENSRALLIPAQYILDWKNKYPAFNDYILNLYQKRFYNLLDAFNALAFQSLDSRLIALLRSKQKALQTNRIETTHQELTEELGAARESISRIIKKLEVEDKVNLHRGWIEIL